MTYRQKYYLKNKEKEKEVQRIWNENHPWYRRQQYRNNREKLIEYAKKYYRDRVSA